MHVRRRRQWWYVIVCKANRFHSAVDGSLMLFYIANTVNLPCCCCSHNSCEMIGDAAYVFPCISFLSFYLLTRILHSYSGRYVGVSTVPSHKQRRRFGSVTLHPLILLSWGNSFHYLFVAVCRLCPAHLCGIR
jgi:hypothetical protein